MLIHSNGSAILGYAIWWRKSLYGDHASFDKLRMRCFPRGTWQLPFPIFLILSLSKDAKTIMQHRRGEMERSEEIDLGALIETQPRSAFSVAVLVWSCVLMLVEGYDMQVMAYAAPAMIVDWHIDRSALGPVFGAGLFGYMLGATILSHFADRFGRKRVILAGFCLFGVFTLAAAFADSLLWLLVLRFVAGLGLGGSIPTAIALNAEYAPASRRATRIALMFLGYTLGAAGGGVLMAALLPRFGWPIAFLTGGLAPLALSAALWRTLPESPRFLALGDPFSAPLAAIAAKLRPDLVLPDRPRFVLREAQEAGLPLAHLFREGRARLTLLLWAAFVTSFLGHHFLTSWLPTVLASDGLPLGDAVLAAALFQGGGAFGSVFIGRLVDRRGIPAIAAIFAVAAPLVAVIGVPGLSEAVLMGAVFIAGLFVLGGQFGLNALAGTCYPTFIRSTGVGWALGIGRVGSVLGPVVGGILIALGLPTWLLLICAAVPLLICAGATLCLGLTKEAFTGRQ
jgi:AAHS family 4-hydroxybenzoate transporter-like MFS transporter